MRMCALMSFVVMAAAISGLPQPLRAQSQAPVATDDIAKIRELAAASQCAARRWTDRGRAPRAYVVGVALVFARSVCHPDRADVEVASAAAGAVNGQDDALVVYRKAFAALGMHNDQAGTTTLRHAYALLIGLGMMESSGKYCEGRDVSQCFAEADSAEAGLFQTSYGARKFNRVLEPLFRKYTSDHGGCLAQEFGEPVCPVRRSHNPRCPDATSEPAGTGDGADWQRLTKACPAFATEYGIVVMRAHGGPKGEFNPIRKKEVELRPECDAMLHDVETYVERHRDVCSGL